jgi:hypothetical protein
MFDDIFCAISGITPDENEFFDDAPLGWVKITVERKHINPQWAAVQMVKKGLIETTLAALPEDQRELQRLGIEIQVEAQFYGYESEIDQFITQEEEVFVSPPERDETIGESWSQIEDALGLEENFALGVLEETKEEEEEEGQDEQASK